MTSTPIARIGLPADVELRVSLQQDRLGRPVADIRIFDIGGGPAKISMPTKTGLTIPVQDLGELIEALRAAELASRVQGVTT